MTNFARVAESLSRLDSDTKVAIIEVIGYNIEVEMQQVLNAIDSLKSEMKAEISALKSEMSSLDARTKAQLDAQDRNMKILMWLIPISVVLPTFLDSIYLTT